MGVVASPLALEIASVIVAAIFALEAFVPRPGLNQRAVDAEMFTRQPAFLLGNGQYRIEEFDDRIVGNQAFPVLGENRRHPDSIVHRQANEPAK